MKYKKDVTDHEVETDYMRIYKSEIKPFLVPRVKMDDGYGKPDKTQKKTKQKRKDTTPNDEEKQLLRNVFERPNLSITKRTAMLGLTPYKMNKLKNSVIDKELAVQFTINLGKSFGGNITLLELLDDGYKAIGKKGASKKLQNESYEHCYWKKMLYRYYDNKKIPAEIEKLICGKHADVGIRHKGKDIAAEVELSPRNALTNIIQDLKAGFDKVLSCSKNKKIQDEILRQFYSHPEYEQLKNKVSFRLLSDFEFVKELK